MKTKKMPPLDGRQKDHTPKFTPEQRAAAIRELAVDTLSQPIPGDRDRSLEIHGQALLLGDDSGGEDIASFDDATAVHYFLAWLRDRRAELAAEWDIAARRKQMHIVDGGRT
jgi:hypothetical protein